LKGLSLELASAQPPDAAESKVASAIFFAACGDFMPGREVAQASACASALKPAPGVWTLGNEIERYGISVGRETREP